MNKTCALTRPELPTLLYEDWDSTRQTLHRFLQIVGKIRLASQPPLNHWWHVTLYPSPAGLTTGRIPYDDYNSFEIRFNFIDHTLQIRTGEGRIESFSLRRRSVASFYEMTMSAMTRLGIPVRILAHPYDLADQTPFAEDKHHRVYNEEMVGRFWTILSEVANIFETFHSRFLGKSSPVHLFWHSFDLVLTRFSGREAPLQKPGAKRVEQNAYSHELISFGFWTGDPSFQEPAFYAYAYPPPPELDTLALEPRKAFWTAKNGSPLAIYRYEDFRQEADPVVSLLTFLETFYQGAAHRADWPVDLLTTAGKQFASH